VREGRIEELLREEGSVRVRVAPGEVPAAGATLEAIAGPGCVRVEAGPEAGWLEVRIDPDRAAALNRALAAGGIYASRIEVGTNLESLFLEVTGTGRDVGAPPVPGSAPGWPS
jgi:hypothetical protein